MTIHGSLVHNSPPFQNAGPSDRSEGLRFAVEATPIGVVAGAGTEAGLRTLVLLDSDAEAQAWGASLSALPALAGHDLLGWVGDVAWALSVDFELSDLADEKLRAIPLDLDGTPFQRDVWNRLRALAWGETTTYGALAAQMNREVGASQAVAGACAANPVAVVVPCHRVVGASGEMRGYRWGVERKRQLLAREQPPARDLFS
jgi:AraC family transcriptional regulator of adaptative response/methylated-DNA-[protein]-cysteine methyltransferase